MNGAIDKLEIQAPGHDFWTKELRRACEQSGPASDALLRRQGHQYRTAIDLRRQGISAVLYVGSRARGANKLVFLRVGDLAFSDIISQVSALFAADIWRLAVKRIDVKVDVLDYSVSWFKKHTSVTRRRCGSEFGKLYCDGRGRVETLCFGKRPNVIRIYDKWAELEVEARRARTCWGLPTAKSSAHDGLHCHSGSLTRVERQYGGGRIPEELATLAQIQAEALNINPFEPLEFSATGYAPIPDDLGGSPFLKTLGMRTLVEDLGRQGAMAELNHRSQGKAKRLLRGIPGYSDKDEPVKVPDLVTKYRQSMGAQLDYEFRQEGTSSAPRPLSG